MVLVLLLALMVQQHSEFLTKEELHLVRKGVTFELTSGDIHYNLTYDIWKDRYFFYNQEDNKSYTTPDSGLNYIRIKFGLKELTIQEKEKKKKKRSIILFDFVSDLIANKKRLILFETP